MHIIEFVVCPAIHIAGDEMSTDTYLITFHFVVGLLSIRRNRPDSRKIERIVLSKDIYPRKGWIVICWKGSSEAFGFVECSCFGGKFFSL